MKLISIRSARSIWLVPLAHINPQGRYIVPAVSRIVERYGFAKAPDPKSLTELPLKIVFELGSFVGTNGFPIAVNLTVHDDGIVAETRSSTDDGDLFLEDFLVQVEKEFDLPSFKELGVKRIYASELYIQFQKPLNLFNEKFSEFYDAIRPGLDPNHSKPLDVVALIFGSDPAVGAPQSLLRIEHEANTSFADNRYYSYAPIKTGEHLKLLEMFESKAT